MPTTCEVMDPIIIHQETPSPFTPLGAKGLGEGNNMSTPACVANAFADALQTLAVHQGQAVDVRLPLTPERVLNMVGVDDPPSRRAGASSTTPSEAQTAPNSAAASAPLSHTAGKAGA